MRQELESVKIKREYVDILRERKKNVGVPIATSIEQAIAVVFGEPKKKGKK